MTEEMTELVTGQFLAAGWDEAYAEIRTRCGGGWSELHCTLNLSLLGSLRNHCLMYRVEFWAVPEMQATQLAMPEQFWRF